MKVQGQPKRWLRCCCCGDSAGRYHQWSNQDSGYGICRKCIERMLREERETPEQIRNLYGVEGINYATKGYGLTPAEYTSAVNKANQDHYTLMCELHPQLCTNMSGPRTYTDEHTQTYWDRGYWPEHASSALETDNATQGSNSDQNQQAGNV